MLIFRLFCLVVLRYYDVGGDDFGHGSLSWPVQSRHHFIFAVGLSTAETGYMPYRNVSLGILQTDFIMCFRFDLMLNCWMMEPDDRPGFGDIVVRLEDALTEIRNYFDLKKKQFNIEEEMEKPDCSTVTEI